MKNKFPLVVILVDTGKRRIPRNGEYYMWSFEGRSDGPHLCSYDDTSDNDLDDGGWYGGPSSFAIYRMVEEQHEET